MARAPKTEWSALTMSQLVAALARKGFDRSHVRASAQLAIAQGYANVTSTDNTTRALIRYSDTEIEMWDAQTFALPVGKVQLPAESLMVGMVFYLIGSNGVGKYRITSVRHKQFPGRVSVSVDWAEVTPGREWSRGGKGWNAGDMVTTDIDHAESNAYQPFAGVLSGDDARHAMHGAHTVATPRMKPAQRDTRYPSGSWVWDTLRGLYAQVLRTPDMREPSLVLYVPAITAYADDWGSQDATPARTYLAPRTDVMPGANVGRDLSDRGAASVVYAVRPQVPTVDDLLDALRGNPWRNEIELTPAYVCDTCAYAIAYAEWPGDWSESDVADRDAQVEAYAAGVRFVVEYDAVDTLRDDTCAYHGARFVGTMYRVSRWTRHL